MRAELKEYSKYIIFSNGNIWSKSKQHFLSPSLSNDGYQIVNLISKKSKNGYRQCVAVHRIIALAFCPNPNNYKEVNHKDGNKLNNHYSNLEWCTRSYNISHCHKLGLRSSKGINNGNYKTGKYVL